MAAASRSHSPSTLPHVETALRQGDVPNEPETKHTVHKKVDALAKLVLKYVDKHETMMNERGSFDS
jgi:hypothetical protein